MLPGSSGISVLPGFDVNDDQYAFPSNDAEAQCLDTFTAAGLPFESRANVRSGLLFCDSIRLLTIVGSDLDELSAQGVSEAIWRLGAGFQSAAAYDVTFEEGKLYRSQRVSLVRFRRGLSMHGYVRRHDGLWRVSGRWRHDTRRVTDSFATSS